MFTTHFHARTFAALHTFQEVSLFQELGRQASTRRFYDPGQELGGRGSSRIVALATQGTDWGSEKQMLAITVVVVQRIDEAFYEDGMLSLFGWCEIVKHRLLRTAPR